MRALLFFVISLAVASCQISDRRGQSLVMGQMGEKPTQFILLGAGPYEGDLTVALFQEGFKVKPIAVTQTVTEIESQTKLVEYKEAGYRYALKVYISHQYMWTCAFSTGHMVDVTMSVIDIRDNETLAIIKQRGPDGECPPLTPVWVLLARDLSKAWQ
jgi:hypothetical protein